MAEILKFARALEHLEYLQNAMLAWVKANENRTIHKFDPKTSQYAVWVNAKPVDEAALVVLVADFLQNLRAGLDHVAYQLALAHTDPLPDEAAELSQFPIISDVDSKGQPGSGARLWRDSALNKISAMDPAAQAVIESLQPYQRGTQYESDPLWILNHLARIDRHRFPHIVGGQASGFLMPVGQAGQATNFAGIAPGMIQSLGGPLTTEDRTKVAEFPVVPVDPNKPVYVNIRPRLIVQFADGAPLVGGREVEEAMIEIYNHIGSEVMPRLDPFIS